MLVEMIQYKLGRFQRSYKRGQIKPCEEGELYTVILG